MLNFVLCDDNSNILSKLALMLENIFIKYDLQAQIAFTSTEPDKVLDFTQNTTVDILILDINLKHQISGLDLAEKVRSFNKNVYIIFTTGHLEYILLAYKVKTFDYLVKPIATEKLEETILRLFNDIAQSSEKYLNINNKTFINQKNILYIKKDGMKVIICTTIKNYEIYSSFNKLEHCLSDNFVRCHKSYIVNLNNISDISDTTVFFSENSSCSIGPKYKIKFLEVLKNGNLTNNLDIINN